VKMGVTPVTGPSVAVEHPEDTEAAFLNVLA